MCFEVIVDSVGAGNGDVLDGRVNHRVYPPLGRDGKLSNLERKFTPRVLGMFR